jgi:ethanolamine utilization protein EutA
MISVGIDVGTTTTQIVFSRLEVADVALPGRVPRFNVTAKSIVYESPIYFTPLINPEVVDVQALTELVTREYHSAGINPDQVETGAVIITGEIARTQNADEILRAVSKLAGDFVVTVAGPNVESQIAGRGSGAATYSVEHFTTVTNVDIGGGTSNAAIFRVGEHVSSSALAVGGRQLIIERTSGIVRHIAPPGKIIVKELGLPIYEGKRIDIEVLTRFTDCMADLVADLVTGVQTDLGNQLLLAPPLTGTEGSKVLFISGGVGAYYYNPVIINSLSDVLIHDDVGPLFAQSLRLNERIRKMRTECPAQTRRATVLGASNQTVTLSGSTIWAEAKMLPLRNLPVIRPKITHEELKSPAQLSNAIRTAIKRWDVDRETAVNAIALDLPRTLDYQTLLNVAEGIASFAATDIPADTPLVLVIEMDFAQALGQTVKSLSPQLPLISIDQVWLGEGDFIDIGEPIMGGRVVPLSVKTLIFYN